MGLNIGIPTLFTTFIIIVILLHYHMNKADREKTQHTSTFWKKEAQALSSRKKTLSESDYIVPDPSVLPAYDVAFYDALEAPELYVQQLNCIKLTELPMMNLAGLLNSEVMARFGPGQLDQIRTYEDHFTTYTQQVINFSKALFLHKCYDAIVPMLEDLLRLGADASTLYILLGQTYAASENQSALVSLIATVQDTAHPLKRTITETLQPLVDETLE